MIAVTYLRTQKGQYAGRLPDLLLPRFWSKVDIRGADECWPWLGCRNAKGYGEFWIEGESDRAHRVAARIAIGLTEAARLDEGVVVRHDCDNPCCCNPLHLRLGTIADNNRDRQLRGRTRNGALINRGERHYAAKLTESDVLDIRARYVHGIVGYKTLAKDYDVRWDSIRDIVKRRRWAWLKKTK